MQPRKPGKHTRFEEAMENMGIILEKKSTPEKWEFKSLKEIVLSSLIF